LPNLSTGLRPEFLGIGQGDKKFRAPAQHNKCYVNFPQRITKLRTLALSPSHNPLPALRLWGALSPLKAKGEREGIFLEFLMKK